MKKKTRLQAWFFSLLVLTISFNSTWAPAQTSNDDIIPEVMEPEESFEAPDVSAPPVLETPSEPEPVLEIVEDPTSAPAPVTPLAEEVVEEKEIVKKEEPSIPKGRSDSDKQARDKILSSPTRSLETYEKTRRAHMHYQSIPKWGANLSIAPRAFSNADLRVPLQAAPHEGKPHITGLILSGERVLLDTSGLLSLGAQVGFFGNTHRNQFSGLLTAITTLGPYMQYQANFWHRQLVVPTVKAGLDVTRIDYSFAGNEVNDMRLMPRIDLGALVYLNFLEPTSAGLMQSNYGVKRTYLAIYYSFGRDSEKTQVDLNEPGAWRAGFRFEF